MHIEFKKVTDFTPGTLHQLLEDGYSFDGRFKEQFEKEWIEFDRFFFQNPEIADKYGFITVLDGEPIGLVSWDPRHRPEYVEIGHNCIVSRYKGNGYGKMQLKEAVRRIKEYEGLQRIIVTTSEVLLTAQRNYEAAGFKFKQRRENAVEHVTGDYVDYEIAL